MDLKEVHLKEVKGYILDERKYKSNNQETIYLLDRDIEYVNMAKDTYIKLHEKDVDFDLMIAAYYISDQLYYYLEKVENEYIITRVFRNKNIKVLLNKKRHILFKDEFDFYLFRKICIDFVYKDRIFDYSEEDK